MQRFRFEAPAGTLALICAVWVTIAAQPGSGQSSSPSAQAESKGQSVQEINDGFVRQISKQIAGHEQEPAGQVFKNIHIFNNTPATRLLLIMNLGYSRALGVTCTYCHVEQDFSSDDKRPKRAAREMAAMHRAINDQLAKMQNLDPNPQGHFINCSTCHRGGVDPLASDR
ncbi:MAG TPA: c-type cytochrome [Candidatus Acidoferrales bacterium]|nr:c-type cytochrome [Candidatus Acidoferrales bacterium]